MTISKNLVISHFLNATKVNELSYCIVLNSKNRLNILFLPKWYPNKNNPYHGVFIHRHAIAVNKLHNVFVLFSKANDEPQSSLIEKEEGYEDDIYIVRYYYKKIITGIGLVDAVIKLLLYVYCSFSGYGNIIKQAKKIDLSHVHVLGRSGLIAFYLKNVKKIKYVITEHWSGYLSKINIGWNRRVVLKNSSAISVVSGYLKVGLINNYPVCKNINIIPNVTSAVFLETDYVKNIDFSKKSILHVSDLVDESKNISGLIESIEILSKIRQDFVLKLVGDGVDSEFLKKLVIDKELQSYIKFEGSKDQNELINYYNESTFLVSFSNYETFGITIVESFAMGTPVVVSNLPTFTNFIKECEGGVLVLKGNKDDLVEKMNNMLNEFETYNSENLRNYVLRNYSSKIISNQFDQLYRNV